VLYEGLFGIVVCALLSHDGKVEWIFRQYRLGCQNNEGILGGDLRQHGQKGEIRVHSLSNENHDKKTGLY
jgi:hypothetical protein